MYTVKGLTHFFLMELVQNPPHVHVHNVLHPSLKQTHHFSTKGFLHHALLVVICPLELKFDSSQHVFTQKPNNILLSINNSRTKYKRNRLHYRAYNLLPHFGINRSPIFDTVYFHINICMLHCYPIVFCLYHIQQFYYNSENLCT